MQTPTCDLTDRPEPGCSCLPWKLCPHCYGKLQRARHEWAMQQWLETWGNREVKAERKKPVLRLVRARELVR